MNTTILRPFLLGLGGLLLTSTSLFPQGDAQEQADQEGITIEILDTEIRDALRMVARMAGLSIIVSEKATGTITVELNDATVEQAMGAICHIGGLSYSFESNVYVVSTLGEAIERRQQELEYAVSLDEPAPAPEMLLVKLRYVDAERVEPLITGLLSEGGTVAVLETSDHVALKREAPESHAEGGSELEIGTSLSTTTRGQPARSHTLVVMDIPERLALISSMVEQIDVKPAQILIEARFVEVMLDEDDRMGIDWNFIAGASGASTPHTFPFGRSGRGEYGPTVTGGSSGGLFPPAPNSVTMPGTPGLFTFGTLDFTTFTAVLEMMQRDSDVQIVSSPRISVGDRQTATILVGERFPILRANISEYGTVTEELERYEPIGVQLEVTPSILDDGEVELFVRPSTSSLGPLVEGSTGLTVARINTRQIDTSVTAKDNETVVLGGLITTRDSEAVSRVPVLGSIPLLRHLFQHTSTQREKVDLVVFLTVTILREHELSDFDRQMLERGETANSRRPLDLTSAAPVY